MQSPLKLCCLLALICILFSCEKQTKEEIANADKVSGAYEALNFLGARISYPGNEVPNGAYKDAWRQHLVLQNNSNARGGETWETMGPVNRAGRALALTFNPQNANTLWLGTASGGLWRTHTQGLGGNAWEYIPTGFPVLGVSTIAFPPGDSMTMYIGTGEVYNYQAAGTGAAYRSTRGSYGMGILKSTDGGATWEQSLDWSYDQNRGIWMIKVHPNNPQIVYAATTNGVYKTVNGGDDWEEILSATMATDLVINPDNPDLIVAGCGNLGSPGRGIFRSIDGGDNWEQITENIPPDFQGKIQLNFAPSQPDILYASIGNGFSSASGATWLCRSTDFGASWTVVNETDYSRWQGWFSHDVDVSPTNPNHIVAIGITTWKSTSGGQTLVQETSGGIGPANPDPADNTPGDVVHSDCHDVQYHPTNPDIVYVASDGGVHRSTDGGLTFAFANGGLQTCQFYNGFSIAMTDETIAMGGLQDNGTISWNGDDTWTVILGGDGSWSAINPEDPSIFYGSSQFLNVFRNTPVDGWVGMDIDASGSPAFIAPYVISPTDGNILYAGHGGVSKTVDGGDTWFLTNNGVNLDNGNPVLSMEVASNPDVVYAATAPTTIFGGTRGGMFVTEDGGDTWSERTGDLPDRYPMDITVDPTNEAIAYVSFSGFGTGHVYKTLDYGQNWIDISGDLPDLPTNAVIVDPLYPEHVYVGNDFGVYASFDGGETWESYQEGFYDAVMVFDLKISPTNRKLRAATHGNGAFQRDLAEPPVSTTNIAAVLPEVSVFPNPTKQQSNLRFQLTDAQQLNIRLLNLQGQVVRQLATETFVSGEHTLPVSVTDLPSGNYLLQIQGSFGIHVEKLRVY
ncbi:MAG: T9SS type A sorting domain-containing protein [Bacteroidota bacterium]